MFSKKIIVLIISAFIFGKGIAQNCDLSIKGQILDEESEKPLSFVNIFIQEIAK